MNNRRFLLLSVCLGLLVFGGGALSWKALFAPSPVPTLKVRRQPYRLEVTADGTLKAARATPINAPTNIRERMTVAWIVEDGTPVKKGDVVARFDPSDFEKRLTEGNEDKDAAGQKIGKGTAAAGTTERNLRRDAGLAEKELQQARTYQSKDPLIFSRMDIIESAIDADLAEKKKETAETMMGLKGGLSKTELELYGIEEKKADLKIERAEAALQSIEIAAPHDGVVVLERDWMGNLPRVGKVVWPGMKLGEIPDTTALEAEVFILEADAGSLAKGQKAVVTLEARPGRTFDAKVARVDPLAKPRFPDVPVQYFTATLSLEKTLPALMKQGQRMRARILLEDHPAALVLPRQAVFDRDGKKVVFKQRWLRGFAPVAVTTLPGAMGRVVVTEGLGDGDVVALLDPEKTGSAASAGAQTAGPSVGGAP